MRRSVLAVPVPALRAVAGPAYQVLVADGSGSRPVAATVGIYDQLAGLVEVRGDGLAAGQRVVLPSGTS